MQDLCSAAGRICPTGQTGLSHPCWSATWRIFTARHDRIRWSWSFPIMYRAKGKHWSALTRRVSPVWSLGVWEAGCPSPWQRTLQWSPSSDLGNALSDREHGSIPWPWGVRNCRTQIWSGYSSPLGCSNRSFWDIQTPLPSLFPVPYCRGSAQAMAAACLLHFHRNTPLLSDPPGRLKDVFIHVYSTREYIQKPFPGIATRRMPVS